MDEDVLRIGLQDSASSIWSIISSTMLGWSIPYEGVVRDGGVYGCGVSNMESGLAAMVYAVEAIRRAGYKLRGGVGYSFIVDEGTAGVNAAYKAATLIHIMGTSLPQGLKGGFQCIQ